MKKKNTTNTQTHTQKKEKKKESLCLLLRGCWLIIGNGVVFVCFFVFCMCVLPTNEGINGTLQARRREGTARCCDTPMAPPSTPGWPLGAPPWPFAAESWHWTGPLSDRVAHHQQPRGIMGESIPRTDRWQEVSVACLFFPPLFFFRSWNSAKVSRRLGINPTFGWD